MKYKLSLKAIAYSHDGLEYGTGPAILYKIQGLPEGENLLLRNVRPRFREGEWQVGDHTTGMVTKWTGAFKTAERALLQLQKEIDSAEETRLVRS
jgi:hypothetical protein